MDECDTFLKNHIPFEIVVNQKLKQIGDINYQKETITLEGSITVNPTNGFDMIRDVVKGLDKTGRKKDWGLDRWPVPLYGEPKYRGACGFDLIPLEQFKVNLAPYGEKIILLLRLMVD